MTAAPTATPLAPELSVVVPTYNERTRIAELIASIFEVFRTHAVDGELVIVDDNSPDGTGDLVDGLVPAHAPRLVVVHRTGKLGLGSAVMKGFLTASAPVLGVMDADFSHPPSALPHLLEVLRHTRVDAVIGSRYIEGGEVQNWPFSRLMLSRLACILAWPLTPVRDATSGFFLIRRLVVEGVDIQSGGFKICLELLMRSRVQSVAEVPYVFVDRTVGTSKMSLREALGYFSQLRQLYGLALARRRSSIRYQRVPPPT
ncbi:MAG: polyprenol monophosphomannose synthase [Vicinamibacteria bacterium]|nr:polyprenol monophosphomannose synthase [Vicinamibacteria bacterium]